MTIIVGSDGQTFQWTDDFGTEDFHGQVGGEDLSIPIIIQKTIGDNDFYMKFEDADPNTTQPKLVVYGDGGLGSAGESILPTIISEEITVTDGLLLEGDSALSFTPVDGVGTVSYTHLTQPTKRIV